MDPEDADYKCTLNEYSLQKALKELNEDPKQRLGAIQTLRKWIREQPHYTCRTDTKFLLAVLRRAKFSQLLARELIDNILTARTTCPEYMANLDIQDPSMLALIELGATVYFPKRDKEGRRIILIRPGVKDLNNPHFSPVNETRFGLAMGEIFRDVDENVQVNGSLLVFDCTGMGMKHLTQATMDHNKKTSRIYQDCNPERIKAFLFYNAGTFFEVLMTFVKSFFKKKNQERRNLTMRLRKKRMKNRGWGLSEEGNGGDVKIQAHDTMESLYKVIPMELWPDEYLPDDYKGPSAGSIASIMAEVKKQAMDPKVRAKILAYTSDKYKIDESKRPADSKTNESFRKLNID